MSEGPSHDQCDLPALYRIAARQPAVYRSAVRHHRCRSRRYCEPCSSYRLGRYHTERCGRKYKLPSGRHEPVRVRRTYRYKIDVLWVVQAGGFVGLITMVLE